jgi:flagellar secretion chaperone FliS
MSISTYPNAGYKMGSKAASEAYASTDLETSINGASPHQLILMLYDGTVNALYRAKMFMEQKNFSEKGLEIAKAISIITDGLASCLNEEKGGDIARNLASLYDYMARRLMEAHLQNKAEFIEEVMNLLNELRGAWAQIGNTMMPSAAHPMVSSGELDPSLMLETLPSITNTGGDAPMPSVSYGKV